jgi:hypothetical protein
MIRHLVDRIVITVQGASEVVEVTIHWAGGAMSQHEALRPISRYEHLSNYPELRARVLQLRQEGQTAARIAEHLNREGFHPPRCDQQFNEQKVQMFLADHIGIEAAPAPDRIVLGCHEWWLGGLAQALSMPSLTLYHWLRRGWIRGRQLPGVSGRWVVWADEKELDRLKRLRSYRSRRDLRPYPSALTTPGRGIERDDPEGVEPTADL